MSIYYARSHLWRKAAPYRQSWVDWIISEVLRLKTELDPKPVLIYANYQVFDLTGNEYLDSWNGMRAELVAKHIDPPAHIPPDITTELELQPPEGHPGEWLLSYVLNYSENEIEKMKSDRIGSGSAMQVVPLIKHSMFALGTLKMKDELLDEYHRSRYLLLRYYLDAYYHVL